MKKALISFGLLVTFFIFYFIQTNFFSWFKIAGIQPNLFVIFVLFIGLFVGRTPGVVFGVICGTFLDLFVGKIIGPTAILLAIVGYLGGYFDKSFSKESKITIILMVIGVTVIYELGKYIINIFTFQLDAEFVPFFRIILIELFYQFLLTIILYPLMKKVGYYIENIFKGNNILTRYF